MAYYTLASTLSATAGIRGAMTLSASNAMSLCDDPGLRPAVEAWRVWSQLIAAIVIIPIIGPFMVSKLRCQCPWPGTSGFPISAQIRSKFLTPIFTSNDPETVSPGLGERILIEGAPVRAARVAGGYWISTELALCST